MNFILFSFTHTLKKKKYGSTNKQTKDEISKEFQSLYYY